MRLKAVFFAYAVFSCLVARASAQMPVYERLRTRESDHFRFIYSESAEPMIPRIARDFEEARLLLSPFFKHAIEGKTIVTVSDDLDIHNGWATPIPTPRTHIYLAGSFPYSSIYEPGDELRRTIFHEYTHLLTMDALYGARKSLAAIFGRVLPLGDPLSLLMTYLTLPPALFAPLWYLESVAMFAETEFVGPGRGRNSLADMILRMAVHDERQLHPAEWDLSLPEWPGGNAAYLYGMRVLQYAHEQYGLDQGRSDLPGALADSVNRSWPFVFDSRSVGETGRTFDQLARDAAAREVEVQQARLASLAAVPFTPLQRLTRRRFQVESPVYAADGQSVYFIGEGEADRSVICRYDFATKTVHRYDHARVLSGTGARLTRSPDGRYLYYSRLEFTGRDRIWKQLFRFDTRTGREERVTREGRYQYPVISPDGRRMAAVRFDAGRHMLVEVPLDQAGDVAAERVLRLPEYGRYIVDPVYLPGGRALLYVESDEVGSRLRRYNLDDGSEDVLLDWPCVMASPALGADGKSLLFTADRNGVYNVYRMSLDGSGEPKALTHVPGGVFYPSESPDGTHIAAAAYDSHGFHLVQWPAAQTVAQPLPVIEPAWRPDPANQRQVEQVRRQPPPELTPARPYPAARNLELDFWSPWLTASADGVQGGLFASVSEPSGRHAVFALAGYDTDAEEGLGSFQYAYSGLYPLLRLYADRQPGVYPELVRLSPRTYEDYYEVGTRAGAEIEIPLLRIDSALTATLGYVHEKTESLDKKNSFLRGRDPAVFQLFEGHASTVYGSLDWFNGTAYGRSHSVEDGRLLRLAGDHAGLGGDLNRTRGTAQWSEYLTLPWGENHVLKLDVLGGTSRGDAYAQGAFGAGGFLDAQGVEPGVSRHAAVRGYPENYRVGEHLARFSAAYRFPVLHAYRGYSSTMPVYAHQLFGEIFYEGGRAWGGDAASRDDTWIHSTGVELNLGFTLLRFLEMAPGAGIAYAFDRERRSGDEDEEVKLQFYFTVKALVNF